MEIPEKLNALIAELKEDSSIMEIWLIGSQASGTSHSKSDWDLLIFSTQDPKQTISRIEGIDILWRGPSDKVLLEGQSMTYLLEFSDFKWIEPEDGIAIYSGRKFNETPNEARDASVPLQSIIESKAIRLWCRR